MGILDKVKTWASDAKEEVKRFKSKNFMEAVTAGCAMVAFADGVIKPEEKAKMAGFIQRNEALSVFDMSQVIKSFEKNVNNFEFDLHIGKGEALKTISKIKKNSDEARLLVRVCCAIGASDGDFDEDEKKVVSEICQELGLDPGEFGISEAKTRI
ncbi:tellurite resistance TerB family protein [Desulfonema magnum]|uniref:Tellurite resistance protein, TerB-like n=1 Tax=Desulfonema magnum TaxID=45655 RepID=A0A975BNX9_9BACT|nr:tellurite resistance TerB family protein [Desulfonema magnum]QTA88390.1 Tellurite resistance protein, TerB-like [Desulfonema magnum]